MKDTLQLVQFSEVGRANRWTPEIGRMYFASNMNARDRFEETVEGEDGNEDIDWVTHRCIKIYNSYENYLSGENVTYVIKEEASHTVFNLHIVNENDEIHLDTKEEIAL